MYTTLQRVRAFTLIELLLVMVILVVLSSIVVVGYPKVRARANYAKARADIHQLGTALRTFEVDCGRFPTSDEGLSALVTNPTDAASWSGPYIEIIPHDPWDDEYVYQCPGTHFPASFDLYSLGPDKMEGNDDVTNWER